MEAPLRLIAIVLTRDILVILLIFKIPGLTSIERAPGTLFSVRQCRCGVMYISRHRSYERTSIHNTCVRTHVKRVCLRRRRMSHRARVARCTHDGAELPFFFPLLPIVNIAYEWKRIWKLRNSGSSRTRGTHGIHGAFARSLKFEYLQRSCIYEYTRMQECYRYKNITIKI